MKPARVDEDLIASVSQRVDPASRTLFVDFASNILAGVSAHPAGGVAVLGTLVVEAFEWAAVRAPGEIRVRVRNPADRPGHTVVEILQDDRPFIVDSLSLAFSRRGFEMRFVLHPLLRVVRNGAGELERVEANAPNHIPLESYVYAEFAPKRDASPDSAALEAAVRELMGWVHDITEDHETMLQTVHAMTENLDAVAASIPGGVPRVDKIKRFLDWITHGRFVFVGTRRYRVAGADEAREVQIIPGTGLGMWRDDASSRLCEARGGSDIPGEIRDDLEDPRIILITKSRMESKISRHGRLDRIVVKEYDEEGRVTGFSIIVGLFTRPVLRTPGSQIPLLAERLREVVDRMELVYGSHDHKAVVEAFDSAPVELLLGADVDAIEDLLNELVGAMGSRSTRLVLRRHPRGRAFYAAVMLPREQYREELRGLMRNLLREHTNASYFDDRTAFIDDDTVVVHFFCTTAEDRESDVVDSIALERALHDLCAPWDDRLLEALRQRYGEDLAPILAGRFESAFPEALRLRTHPTDAVRDIDALEALSETGEPQFALYFDRNDADRTTATLRMVLAEPPLLSDVTQVTETFGLRVVDAQLSRVEPAGRPPAAIESLRIVPLGVEQADLDAISPRLADALAATIANRVPSDTLNRLVLGAGLDWRQIDVLRAYVEYFVQIQGALSRPFLRTVLLENPLAVRALVKAFEARFDPARSDAARAAREQQLRDVFEAYRDRIQSLNEDRALAGLFGLVDATLRTNYFAPRREPHRVVLKLDPGRLSELTGVIPHREIFVHSAEIMGLHLRGGPVARGGLRWSDRLDDLRVEILGLMSTQMLKNGIIVPVGAKGGFALRRTGLSPNEARALADAQYRVFIESLLDVTDNRAPDGSILPPVDVHCGDGDDPYLVVAADKGTAHLSDTANEIAVGRDFWLGDAFASGGSEGYDHKKYAITARGAWECVKHHFAELGIGLERRDYTVAGIGDMSGDVFGNGMIEARHAKLLAAFDHRHIFLDPDPDPEESWGERRRLFDLSRSSWADYDPEKLSAGGAVHLRSAKRIPVPAALKERLGLDADHASGPKLVRAILAMEVDLLWNGGIGTYVKASHESHADVGDRANDAVRIDASALRARVIGEGGNLGLTQAARVQAALRGVHLDTDAIHNSAGVDLSDHEVNYKIALTPLIRSGRLDAAARHEILFAVADDACEAALSHNRSQALALSLDELRSRRDPELFLRATDALCEVARLEPAALGLPDAAAMSDRRTHDVGFTRPELAVLLGLAKQQAQAELVRGELPLAGYVEPLYRSYFPARFRSAHPDALAAHPLRREISALRIANRLIDAGGAALITTLTSELGVDATDVVAAMLQAEDLLHISDYRAALLTRANTSRAGIYSALVELDDGVRNVAHYIVRSGAHDLDAARVERWRIGVDALRTSVADFLSPGELQKFEARRQRLESQGVPPEFAIDIAGLALADRGLNILRVCEKTTMDPVAVARVYARLGDETGMNWVYGRLSQNASGNQWDRMVWLELRWTLLDLQREISEWLVASEPGDPDAAVGAFLERNADVVRDVLELERRAATDPGPSALAVVTGRLQGLRSGGPK